MLRQTGAHVRRCPEEAAVTVSVLIPFRSDNAERDRIWAWMRERWLQTMPGVELVVCDDGGNPGEPFNEGRAWNRCAEQATGDLFVVGESEVAFAPGSLSDAIARVEYNQGWCIPERYDACTHAATAYVLSRDPRHPLWPGQFAPARSFIRESVSPPLIVPREAWDLVGGMDERYEGWGWIDKAFAAAMNTLYRPFERFPGSVFHLDHPRGSDRDCNPELTRRYLAAKGDPDAMRAIIAERSE